MVDMVSDALEFIHGLYRDAKRLDGTPKVDHPIRVAGSAHSYLSAHPDLDIFPLETSDEVFAASLLHDVLEDFDVPIDTVADISSNAVAATVGRLTILPGGSRFSYNARILSGPDIDVVLKSFDKYDNTLDLEVMGPRTRTRYVMEHPSFADELRRRGMPEIARMLDENIQGVLRGQPQSPRVIQFRRKSA